MLRGQMHGLHHWMLFASANEIFVYNLVEGQGKAESLLDGLTAVTHVVVDANVGLLLVATQPSSLDAVVDAYRFKVSRAPRPMFGGQTKTASVVFTVDEHSKKQVYKGKRIGGLAVDDDQGILYVADTARQLIQTVFYNAMLPETNTIYEKLPRLDQVTSLAVDYFGGLFWSAGLGGKADGAITKAKADLPMQVEPGPLTKSVEAAGSLCFRNENLYFAGVATTS